LKTNTNLQKLLSQHFQNLLRRSFVIFFVFRAPIFLAYRRHHSTETAVLIVYNTDQVEYSSNVVYILPMQSERMNQFLGVVVLKS